MVKYLFRFAHLILALLGIVLGFLVYIIDGYTPDNIHPTIWMILTLVLIINGLLLGKIIRGLYLNFYFDNLTGLGNKDLFHLQLKLEMSQEKKTQLSLAMLDLDDFKKINDTFGHPAGDMVLRDLARILKQNVRSTDTVARWGGEEFAIILPYATTDGDNKILERIRYAVQSHDFGSKGNPIKITVSVGFVTYNDLTYIKSKNKPINHTDLFIDLADKALYKAKERKNTVVRWSFDM